MKIFNFSTRDFCCHFRKNSGYYYIFLLSIIVSTIIAIVIVLSSDSYLSLLVSKNKNLYNFINGSVKFSEIFFGCLFKFILPLIIILLLGLNYHTSLLSIIFVSYQFAIFVMTITAIIVTYMFSGVLISLFFIIPVNLLFFITIIFLSVVCLERSSYAKKTKYFKEAYDKFYFSKVFLSFAIIICLSLIISVVFPILLKSSIFFIY